MKTSIHLSVRNYVVEREFGITFDVFVHAFDLRNDTVNLVSRCERLTVSQFSRRLLETYRKYTAYRIQIVR